MWWTGITTLTRIRAIAKLVGLTMGRWVGRGCSITTTFMRSERSLGMTRGIAFVKTMIIFLECISVTMTLKNY